MHVHLIHWFDRFHLYYLIPLNHLSLTIHLFHLILSKSQEAILCDVSTVAMLSMAIIPIVKLFMRNLFQHHQPYFRAPLLALHM